MKSKKFIFLMILCLMLVAGIAACDELEQESKFNQGVTFQNEETELEDGEASNETMDEAEYKGKKENENKEVPDEAQEQSDSSVGFLWKIAHHGNTVFMLGSIHVATEDFYPLHHKIETAFEQSDYLAVEADVVNIDPLQMQQQIDQLARYDDGSTIIDHISSELVTQLENKLEDYGVPMAMVQSYEPWYVSMLLDSLQVMEQGYDPNYGIDYYFLKQAADKKEIIELEGLQFQLELFDQFSMDVQQEMLKKSLQEDENGKESMDNLVKYWKSGDEQGLADILLEFEEESEAGQAYMKALLDDRNRIMADKISEFLNGEQSKTYFVVVGAAHYIGDHGIIELLEDKGYTVEKEME